MGRSGAGARPNGVNSMDTVLDEHSGVRPVAAVREGASIVRRTAAVAALGALLLLAGCNDSTPKGSVAARTTSAAPAAPAQVSVSPASGATDVSPVVPLQVSVVGGEVTKVVLADDKGQPISGSLTAAPPADAAPAASSAGSSSSASSSSPSSPASPAPVVGQATTSLWQPATPLAYGATYTLTATAQNRDHKEVTASTTFTTVTPKRTDAPDVGPLDGSTVGVGLPIRVYFHRAVTDKAAVEKNLKVTTSTPTDGVWHWMSNTEVHFRPSTYWPANSDVRVDANLYGVDFGNGVWGQKNRTVSFHIGPRHVSIADAAAHTLTVYDGDQVAQTFPMSAGSNVNPTRNGPHVVTQISRSVIMDSSTFGLAVDAPGGYRVKVDYAVRISNNGEFVHSAPWSVGSQGYRTVSHGCINLSPSRAQWFYNFAQPGDVVEVKNSIGPMLSAVDGDIYDWAVPGEKWKAGSALQ